MILNVDLASMQSVNIDGNSVSILQLNGQTIWGKIIDKNIHKFVVRATTFILESDTTKIQTTGVTLFFGSETNSETGEDLYRVDCIVDWGDGTSIALTNESFTDNAVRSISHIYPDLSVGETRDYAITITGICESMTLNTSTNGGRGYLSTDLTADNFKWDTYTTLEDIIGINNTAKTLDSFFKGAWINENTTILLPKIVAPNCVSVDYMFAHNDAKASLGARKNGTLIIPNGCFEGLLSCTNFNYCFSQGRDYDDGSVVSRLKIKLEGNIFPSCTTTIAGCFKDCTIINAIPYDFLYSLTDIQNMAQTFQGVDNTGFTLPSRWLPSDMSKVTKIYLFMGLNSDGGDDGATPTVRHALFYGTMEDIWDRSDLNIELDATNAFNGATTLDNYNEIPSSWGGGGA